MKIINIMEEINKILSKIFLLLEEKGIDQKILADKIDMSEGWVTRIKKQEINLSLNKFFEILSCLDISPADFFCDHSIENATVSMEDIIRKILKEEIVQNKGD